MKININGLEVDFPYTPYPEQLEYMQDLLESFCRGQNCALEAQTGFGKTLCILCVAKAFVETCKTIKHLLVRQAPLPDDLRRFAEGAVIFRDALQNPVSASQLHIPQLIYASRTHSQLSQVSKVMKQLNMIHVTLASRNQYCSSDDCRQYCQSLELNFRQCCTQFQRNDRCILNKQTNVEASATEVIMHPAMDIEDFKMYCRTDMVCPYYTAKATTKKVPFVLTPYHYIFRDVVDDTGEQADGSANLRCAKNIIILDEAHNVPNVCCEEYSAQIHMSDIEDCLIMCQFIDQTIRYEKKNALNNYSKMEHQITTHDDIFAVVEFLTALYNKLKHLVDSNTTTLQRVATFKEHNYVAVSLKDFVKPPPIRLQQTMEKIDYFVNQGEGRTQFKSQSRLGKLVELVAALGTESHSGSFGVLIEKLEERRPLKIRDQTTTPQLLRKLDSGLRAGRKDLYDSVVVQITCYNPNVAMQILRQQSPLSIVLTSGTLSPMQYLDQEFGLTVDLKRSFKHVCKPENVRVEILSSYQGQSLQGTYDKRDSASFQDAVLNSIRALQKKMPCGGALVFFQSYSVMAKYKPSLMTMGGVYFELKDPASSLEQLRLYKQTLATSPAILCCVYGGKYSEGVDFYDQQCRQVLLVSIPYAAALSAPVIEKQRYFDSIKNGMIGKTWYDIQAFRSVNQAAGRAIRHAEDFGSVAFLDARFQTNISKLSMWLRQAATLPVEKFMIDDGWLSGKIRAITTTATRLPNLVQTIRAPVVTPCIAAVSADVKQLQPQQARQRDAEEQWQITKKLQAKMNPIQRTVLFLQLQDKLRKQLSAADQEVFNDLVKEKRTAQSMGSNAIDNFKQLLSAAPFSKNMTPTSRFLADALLQDGL